MLIFLIYKKYDFSILVGNVGLTLHTVYSEAEQTSDQYNPGVQYSTILSNKDEKGKEMFSI